MFLHDPDIPGGERKGSTGMLVTTGRFTSAADAQARRTSIILLDGEWVSSAIVNFGLGVTDIDGELNFDGTELKREIQRAVSM